MSSSMTGRSRRWSNTWRRWTVVTARSPPHSADPPGTRASSASRPQAADGGDTLRTLRAGLPNIVRSKPANRIEGQRHAFAHRGETLPANAFDPRVARRRFQRTDHGEVAAQGLRGPQIVDAVARGGQG